MTRPNKKISAFGRNDKAWLGKVHHLFGEALPEMLASLNDALAA